MAMCLPIFMPPEVRHVACRERATPDICRGTGSSAPWSWVDWPAQQKALEAEAAEGTRNGGMTRAATVSFPCAGTGRETREPIREAPRILTSPLKMPKIASFQEDARSGDT